VLPCLCLSNAEFLSQNVAVIYTAGNLTPLAGAVRSTSVYRLMCVSMGEIWFLGLGANPSLPFPPSSLALEVGPLPFLALPSRPSSPLPLEVDPLNPATWSGGAL